MEEMTIVYGILEEDGIVRYEAENQRYVTGRLAVLGRGTLVFREVVKTPWRPVPMEEMVSAPVRQARVLTPCYCDSAYHPQGC